MNFFSKERKKKKMIRHLCLLANPARHFILSKGCERNLHELKQGHK